MVRGEFDSYVDMYHKTLEVFRDIPSVINLNISFWGYHCEILNHDSLLDAIKRSTVVWIG